MYIYIYCIICSYQTSTGDLQERLREAAKARIRRMCQAHKKKAQYNVPQFVVEQWKTQKQNEMAQLLMDCNWSKERIEFVLFH